MTIEETHLLIGRANQIQIKVDKTFSSKEFTLLNTIIVFDSTYVEQMDHINIKIRALKTMSPDDMRLKIELFPLYVGQILKRMRYLLDTR